MTAAEKEPLRFGGMVLCRITVMETSPRDARTVQK